MSYFFFFSYAENQGYKKLLDKFYNNLIDEFHDQLGDRKKEEIGFREEEIEIGESRSESLANALRTSQVFIYIHSPTYFRNELCGKEWFFFRRRIEEYVEGHPGIIDNMPTFMFPVFWTPTIEVPRCVVDIQLFSRDLGEVYKKEGLRNIMKLDKYKDDYEIIINRLVKKIVWATRKHQLPEFKNNPDIKGVKSFFQENLVQENSERDGLKCSQFVYVAAKRDEILGKKKDVAAYGSGGYAWKPYFPEYDKKIGIIAHDVAESENFIYLYEQFNINRLITKIEDAKKRSIIIIIIIDPWTLRLNSYLKIMQEYAGQSFYNSAILSTLNYDDIDTDSEVCEQLKNEIRTTFKYHNNPDMFRSEISSVTDLKDAISMIIDKVRSKILNNAPIYKRFHGDKYVTLPRNSPES